jgi:hypothetical protein
MRTRTPISRIFKQLGFLRFGASASRPSADEQRVMHLFRNRAELKKSYNQAQGELQQSRDRLKQQEGLTAQWQERLQALELRLAQPETGYQALVFYQLRDLWHVGRGLLEALVRELRQQREAVERGAFQREFQRHRELRMQALERSCHELEEQASETTATAQAIALQLGREQGWWRYFRRRALRRRLHEAGQRQLESADALQAARTERELVANEPEPRFPGLSLAMRRAINVTAISYAQVLYGRLESSALLEPVRMALAAEEVPGTEYGDRAACELLMAQIQRTRWSLQQRIMLRDQLQQVTLGLRPLLRYAGEHVSVPDPMALAEGSVGTRVLQEDAWEISALLL